MTIKEKMTEMLESNGLWPDESRAVLELAINNQLVNSMAERWNDDISGYPKQLLSVVWDSIKKIAIEWIDQNKPAHFARPMLIE